MCAVQISIVQTLHVHMHVQLDQELGLILGKSNAKGAFLSEWSTKYVPAIVSYGEKSRKTAFADLITSMHECQW